jgi:Asp-tRNA(Asn)/Glu-tRNA(Gln) amidotransferase B subunit
LPWERRERYKKEFELKMKMLRFLLVTPEWGTYFEALIADFKAIKNSLNLLQTILPQIFWFCKKRS